MSKERIMIKKIVVKSGDYRTTLLDGEIQENSFDPYKIPDKLSDLRRYVAHLQEVIEVMEEK